MSTRAHKQLRMAGFVKSAVPRWQKMLPQLSEASQQQLITGTRPSYMSRFFGNPFSRLTADPAPLPVVSKGGTGSSYGPEADYLSQIRGRMRTNADPMNLGNTTQRITQGQAFVDPRINFLSGLASSHPGMPRPANTPKLLSDAVGWLQRKGGPDRWSAAGESGFLVPHLPSDISGALQKHVAQQEVSRNPFSRLGGLVNRQVMKLVPGLGTQQRPWLVGKDPLIRRHELGHWRAISQPESQLRVQTAATLGKMQQADPTFLDRLTYAQRTNNMPRASSLVDEVTGQYNAVRSNNPRARRVIGASINNWGTPGTVAQVDPRLASVNAHLERNYRVPSTVPLEMSPSSATDKNWWQDSRSLLDGYGLPKSQPGLLPSSAALQPAYRTTFKNKPLFGLDQGTFKAASLSRRMFLDRFLNLAKAAPGAYVENSVANLKAVVDPRFKISRRTFAWNIPRAGLLAHVTGMDKAIWNGMKKVGPAVGKGAEMLAHLAGG